VISVLALSPAVDVTYEIDELAVGQINRPRVTTVVAGGKALNMARAAKALGAEVHVVVALGGANGERIRRGLRDDGIAATVVPIVAETRTCLAIVERDGGASSTDVYESAAPLTAREWADFADAVERAPLAEWTALSGSLPAGVPPDRLADVLAGARRRGSRVALDAAGDLLAQVVAAGDLVKVNRHEAEGILGRGLRDAAEAAEGVGRRFGVDAVVTDGIRPGAAAVGGARLEIPPPAAPGRFPAGSGDSFFAGLVHGLQQGMRPDRAVDLARRAAESNARRAGQGVLDLPLGAS